MAESNKILVTMSYLWNYHNLQLNVKNYYRHRCSSALISLAQSLSFKFSAMS